VSSISRDQTPRPVGRRWGLSVRLQGGPHGPRRPLGSPLAHAPPAAGGRPHVEGLGPPDARSPTRRSRSHGDLVVNDSAELGRARAMSYRGYPPRTPGPPSEIGGTAGTRRSPRPDTGTACHTGHRDARKPRPLHPGTRRSRGKPARPRRSPLRWVARPGSRPEWRTPSRPRSRPWPLEPARTALRPGVTSLWWPCSCSQELFRQRRSLGGRDRRLRSGRRSVRTPLHRHRQPKFAASRRYRSWPSVT